MSVNRNFPNYQTKKIAPRMLVQSCGIMPHPALPGQWVATKGTPFNQERYNLGRNRLKRENRQASKRQRVQARAER